MYKRILVPVDGSETSDLALGAAIRLAQTFNSRIRVVHAVDDSVWMYGNDMYGGGTTPGLYEAVRASADELLRKKLAQIRAAGLEADMMLFDEPGQRLGEAVATAAKLWNADLIVVGTHGRRGFDRFLMGSGAEQVIRLAPAPVLVIRGSETTPKEKP